MAHIEPPWSGSSPQLQNVCMLDVFSAGWCSGSRKTQQTQSFTASQNITGTLASHQRGPSRSLPPPPNQTCTQLLCTAPTESRPGTSCSCMSHFLKAEYCLWVCGAAYSLLVRHMAGHAGDDSGAEERSYPPSPRPAAVLLCWD